MIPTCDLIDLLADGLTPVRRLRDPMTRAAQWLLLASIVTMMVIVAHGARPDFWQCLLDRSFVVSTGASVLTSICATVAAFLLSLPDRSRGWALLPLPGLAVWLSTLGYQCLTNWVAFDPDGTRWGEAARCFSALVMVSLPLAITILVMLRHAAPLRPALAALTAGLSVSAITATAMSLIHNLNASVMILAWNLGTVVIVIGASGTIGRRFIGLAFGRS